MAENKLDYVEYDKNMVVESSIGDKPVKLFDVRSEPFEVYGFYDYKNQPWFIRMPDGVAAEVSDGVNYARRESSGGRVRFSTDSEYIAIKAEMGGVGYNSRLPLLETGGFDLYVDGDFSSRFEAPFTPPFGMKEGYEQIVKFRTKQMRDITINFPVHSKVKSLMVGIEPTAELGGGKKYRNKKPVVCYGSSITHGTAASRPGLTYPNMLSRALNIDVYNLGFSGHCKGEPRMAEYIADMEMSAFVMDYDENGGNAEYLEATHRPFFDIIRAKHPTLPVIMLSRPSIYPESKTHNSMREVIRKTYLDVKAGGDENVYFIDGGEYIKKYGYDDCILDGIHPNDLGFKAMSEAILEYLRPIVEKGEDFN